MGPPFRSFAADAHDLYEASGVKKVFRDQHFFFSAFQEARVA
jgi:hypothetical protein